MRNSKLRKLGWILFGAIATNYFINSQIMFAQIFHEDYADLKIKVLNHEADPKELLQYGFNFPNDTCELEKLRDYYRRESFKSGERSLLYGYFKQ